MDQSKAFEKTISRTSLCVVRVTRNNMRVLDRFLWCREIILKYLAIIILLILPAFTHAGELVTPSAKAIITQLCEEGEVTCSKVKLELIEISSDTTLHAFGKTRHSKCRDGTTPCTFQGWEFYNKNGVATIFITSAGTVTMKSQEGEVTFEESGTWR